MHRATHFLRLVWKSISLQARCTRRPLRIPWHSQKRFHSPINNPAIDTALISELPGYFHKEPAEDNDIRLTKRSSHSGLCWQQVVWNNLEWLLKVYLTRSVGTRQIVVTSRWKHPVSTGSCQSCSRLRLSLMFSVSIFTAFPGIASVSLCWKCAAADIFSQFPSLPSV